MKLLKRIWLALTYGPELDYLVKKRREEIAEREREARQYHLNLCTTHQQEHNHSTYSEHNCDYCKLIRLYKDAVDEGDVDTDYAGIKEPMERLVRR